MADIKKTNTNVPLPPDSAALRPGVALAEYRIVKKIASGGFSTVYLAYDEDENRVAIKEYLPSALVRRADGDLSPIVPEENITAFRIGLKCFFEEGRALAKIAHPNVVRVLNFFRENDTVYMVMAYEAGKSLQDHIIAARNKGDKKVMSERTIRMLFYAVMNGLREVHIHKLLHLDIKPGNIYLRDDLSPILLDFGAARQTLTEEVSRMQPMYTPGFAAPELYRKQSNLGPWTDIYSIGATIYACMAGAPPQEASHREKNDKMDEHFQRLSTIYTRELVELVRWCLQVAPEARPQSVFSLQKIIREQTVAMKARQMEKMEAEKSTTPSLLKRFFSSES